MSDGDPGPRPRLGFANLVSSLVRWAMGLTVFLGFAVSAWCASWVMGPRRFFPVARAAFRLMIRAIGIRVEAEGAGNLDQPRGFVMMVNHTSFLDHFVMATLMARHMAGLEKAENFRVPVYGSLIRWWGNVPVVREDPEQAREAIRRAEGILAGGTAIGLAPEGTRSRDGRLGPFKKGGFHLARETKAPIVPVSMLGMHEVNPDRKFRIVPGTVKVIVHPPIDSTEGTLEELIARVRATIASVGIPESDRQ